MKIAIDINGVIRDVFTKASQIYEKFYIEDKLDTINSEFDTKTEEWVEKEDEKSFEYSLNLPVTNLNLINHFKFPNKEELYDFFYVDFPMQIFGHSSSLTNTTFNELNDFYLKFRDENEIALISDEMGKSKPATLFFLSKYGTLLETIKFYSNITMNKVMNEFDIILTANPNIITLFSESKKVIKFNTTYNNEIESKYQIDKLSEFEEILNKIINNEI